MSSHVFKPTRSDVYDYIDPQGRLRDAAKDKKVMITGAGSGIGRAVAIAFAQAGASSLVLSGRSVPNLKSTRDLALKAGGAHLKVEYHSVDVSDRKAVSNLFESHREAFNVDVLVNSAGALEACTSLETIDIDTWWNIWEVTVLGTFLFTRFVLSYATPERPVTIIMTSSQGCDLVTPGWSAYQCAKLAINRIVEFVETENKHKGVKAFAYHPGMIWTSLTGGKIPATMQSTFTDTVELPGAFCVWLTTQEADFLSGRFVAATWDVEEILEHKDEIISGGLLKTRVNGLHTVGGDSE